MILKWFLAGMIVLNALSVAMSLYTLHIRRQIRRERMSR